jgi:hypothetical protein
LKMYPGYYTYTPTRLRKAERNYLKQGKKHNRLFQSISSSRTYLKQGQKMKINSLSQCLLWTFLDKVRLTFNHLNQYQIGIKKILILLINSNLKSIWNMASNRFNYFSKSHVSETSFKGKKKNWSFKSFSNWSYF